MAQNGTWERVEPQLYRLKHQTPTGEWTTRYYVRFRDWKGVNRRFPAGPDLRAARTKKRLLLGDNERRADFDKDKVQHMVFARWAERFLDLKKHRKSVSRYQTALKYLSPVFGPLPLEQITRAKVEEYKNLRREQQSQYGRPPQDSTVNRELATLRHLLALARDEGLIETVPVIKLYDEKRFARERFITEEEHKALLATVKRPVQRVLICLYETAMRPAEPLALTWPKVDLKAGVIRLAAEDVKEADKRVIPISSTLRALLEELREEQRKVASIGGAVFTRNGRPIRNYRTAFEEAREKTGLKDVTPHDYRHTAITRWLLAGIPQEVVMKVSGHKDLSVHYRYVNLREEHVTALFSAAPLSNSWQTGLTRERAVG
jgi:integrase